MDKEKNLKDLEFVENLLREIKRNNNQSQQFSLGIMLGLVLGILGNAWISLLSYLVPETFLEKWALLLFLILNFLVCFFIIMHIRDDKKFKKGDVKLEQEIEKVLKLKEDIEEGRISISNRELKTRILGDNYGR